MTNLHVWKTKTHVAFVRGRKGRRLLAALLLSCLMGLSFDVLAQQRTASQPKADEKHRHPQTHSQSKVAQANEQGEVEFSMLDMEVLDQNGRKRKFYTDLVKGKVVVINFIYTSCKAICPMSGSNFAKLQTLLGDRLGRDVHLISVTTDPETDSSLLLRDWGARFKARDGWTLITGQKKMMTDLLEALTGDGPRTGYHVPAICIVNDKKDTQQWTYGLAAPQQLLRMVDEVIKRPAPQ
jgi:Uncharacterized protein SCO1/SenC/PrrC, involved in biogenesis of respiratory and photosynthetic systems